MKNIVFWINIKIDFHIDYKLKLFIYIQ